MTTAHADLPPYDPQRVLNAPFPERVRLACRTWANSSPNRPSVMALYWGKYFFVLIGVWAFWCSFNAAALKSALADLDAYAETVKNFGSYYTNTIAIAS